MGEKVINQSLYETRPSAKASFPTPSEGEIIYETPPTFIWNASADAREYSLAVRDASGGEVIHVSTTNAFFTPSIPLAPGKYSWSVTSGADEIRARTRFEISEDSLVFDKPTARELWDSVPSVRPRHLFFAEDIPSLLSEHAQAFRTLRRNCEIAYRHGFPLPPDYHKSETAVPYRKYFGEFRDFCDRDLVATALKYALDSDDRAGKHAKALLLRICNMLLDEERYLTSGALNAATGDEVGLSVARCLPSVFDLLYPLLSEDERATVCRTVYIYGDACSKRLREVDYIGNPASSHAGRLPAYLGEAAVVLKGTGVASDTELLGWISEALDIYCGIFPYYGSPDGSWAEGAFYCSSYTKWYLPFFSLVERYTGKSLMQRPFYHRFTSFLMHFVHPRYEIHPFGDGYWCSSDSPEWPGFFAQNPYNVYAQSFGPKQAQMLCASLEDCEYFKLHLLDIFLPRAKAPERTLSREPRDAEVFEYGGFIALHSDFYDENGVTLLARASRFGSDSHRHADQGSFALFSGGTALISPSGYFGFKFGTEHHIRWTNSTKAHNTLLINGKGQPENSMHARARIISFDGEEKRAVIDLSDAYGNVARITREFSLTERGARIVDTVESDTDIEITYPLHTLSMPYVMDNGHVGVRRNGAELEIAVSGDALTLDSISDEYDVALNEGVREDCHVTMPEQYHIYYKSKSAKYHKICTDYIISKATHI